MSLFASPEFLILFSLFFFGVIAGVSNAIAGGGTFFTFPIFMMIGIPPVVANASNAIAVWPGHALAILNYRNEIASCKRGLGLSILICIIGGVIGAILLSYVGNQIFIKSVPFLILFATLLFAFSSNLVSFFKFESTRDFGFLNRFSEFLFAIYGGFFGAGLGVMLMAGLHMNGVHEIQINNALKNLFAMIITTVSAIVFIFSGLIAWKYTVVAFIGAAIGGYYGAIFAKSMSPTWFRRVVVGFGFMLTIHYFFKYH